MKLAQRKIKWLARLMLVLLLFAQGIVAVNACVASSPTQAFSMAEQGDEAMPCHDEEIPNTNACLSHCTQPDQISVDQHHMPLTAPVSVIAWASIQPQAQHIPPVIYSEHLALDTGPPIPIRFCSFLN
jgi:hypothetical protein